MKKRKLDPNIIRAGDYVRIIKPDMFVRCGYPLSKKQAMEDVSKLFGNVIDDLIYSIDHGDEFLTKDTDGHYRWEKTITLDGVEWKKDKCYREIIGALAHRRLMHKRYGGNERTVHTENKPDLINMKATVVGIKFVQSGYYNTGYSGLSYEGEWDGEPAHLSNNKTHKILKLDFYSNYEIDEYGVGQLVMLADNSDFEWVEATNVKKISAEEYNAKDKIINPIDRLEVI